MNMPLIPRVPYPPSVCCRGHGGHGRGAPFSLCTSHPSRL